MENLRGFEYKFIGSSSKISIRDIRFKKVVRINYDYKTEVKQAVINFLESKNIVVLYFCEGVESDFLLSTNFENQIK